METLFNRSMETQTEAVIRFIKLNCVRHQHLLHLLIVESKFMVERSSDQINLCDRKNSLLFASPKRVVSHIHGMEMHGRQEDTESLENVCLFEWCLPVILLISKYLLPLLLLSSIN